SAGGGVFVAIADPWPRPRSEPSHPSWRRPRFCRPHKKPGVLSDAAVAPIPFVPALREGADRRSNLSSPGEPFGLSAHASSVGLVLASQPEATGQSNSHRR